MLIEQSCSCGRDVFCRHPMSGEVLCRICFSQQIERKVLQSLSKFKMLSEQDHIAIGLSGGKDSGVLLYIMSIFKKRYPHSKITAIVIDEGISEYRDQAIATALQQAKKLSVRIELFSFENMFEHSLDYLISQARKKAFDRSPCAICGTLRRSALSRAAKLLDADKIATGHNLDDEAQTILMNLIRGDSTRLFRLSRIPKQRHPLLVPRIKPLVELSQLEIVLYAHANDIRYHSEECPYASFAMRNSIRLFLYETEQAHPGTLINILRIHNKILSQTGGKNISPISKFDNCQNCGDPANRDLCSSCDLLMQILS